MRWCTSGRSDRDRRRRTPPAGTGPGTARHPPVADRDAAKGSDLRRCAQIAAVRRRQGLAGRGYRRTSELARRYVRSAHASFPAHAARACSRFDKSIPRQVRRSGWSPRVRGVVVRSIAGPNPGRARRQRSLPDAASLLGRCRRGHLGPHRRTGTNPLRADARRAPSPYARRMWGGRGPVRRRRSADWEHQGLGACRRGDDRGAGWRLRGGSTGG
jgi:hypothetical protein